MRTRLVLPVLAVAVAAAAFALAAGGESSPAPEAASAPDAARRDVLYYSDLGPDRIDVSTYPAEQRRNYAVYVQVCSRCHSLARSINAPYTSRGWWEFYMTGMRMRGRAAGRPFSRAELKAALDFLEYDSRVRKVQGASAFEKSTRTLKRRFNALFDERMNDLQNAPQPRLLP